MSYLKTVRGRVGRQHFRSESERGATIAWSRLEKKSIFDEGYELATPCPTWSSSFKMNHVAAKGSTGKWTHEETVLIRWPNKPRRRC